MRGYLASNVSSRPPCLSFVRRMMQRNQQTVRMTTMLRKLTIMIRMAEPLKVENGMGTASPGASPPAQCLRRQVRYSPIQSWKSHCTITKLESLVTSSPTSDRQVHNISELRSAKPAKVEVVTRYSRSSIPAEALVAASVMESVQRDSEPTPADNLNSLVLECGLPPHKISELLQELPPQRFSDVLVDFYFNTMYVAEILGSIECTDRDTTQKLDSLSCLRTRLSRRVRLNL